MFSETLLLKQGFFQQCRNANLPLEKMLHSFVNNESPHNYRLKNIDNSISLEFIKLLKNLYAFKFFLGLKNKMMSSVYKITLCGY